MGFFKKIFKGVGKVFKKIGRGIKKVVGKFGKFMNRIGVVGQIAMAFILPGIGNALASGLGSMLGLQGVTGMSTLVGGASGAGGLLGSSNALLQGAGKVLQFAGKVASAPGKVFSSITNGVTSTIKEFSKTALSKMGVEGKIVEGAAESYFFGADSAASRVGTAIKAPFTEKAVLEAAAETTYEPITSDNVDEVLDDVSKLESPSISQSISTASPKDFQKNAEMVTAQTPATQDTRNYLEKGVDAGKEVLTDVYEDTMETVEAKAKKLTDPKEVAKTAFEVYRDRQSEEELAAQQAAMFGGDVIDVGIYQDPSAFLTYQTQNTVAPIQSFQTTAAYTKPMASWAQQFVYQPDVNVGAIANTSYDRFSNASYDRGF